MTCRSTAQPATGEDSMSALQPWGRLQLAAVAALAVAMWCCSALSAATGPAGPQAAEAAAAAVADELLHGQQQVSQRSLQQVLTANLLNARASAYVTRHTSAESCGRAGYHWEHNTCWTSSNKRSWCEDGYRWRDSCACCNKSESAASQRLSLIPQLLLISCATAAPVAGLALSQELIV